MRFLVDTDLAIDHVEGRKLAVDLLSALLPDGLAMSVMTYAEIYEGILYGRMRTSAEAQFGRLLRWIKVLPLDEPIMRRFALIRGSLREQGALLNNPDLMIAATALELDLTLVTRNRKHFDRIDDLRLHDLQIPER